MNARRSSLSQAEDVRFLDRFSTASVLHAVATYGLLMLLALLIIFFSLLLPDTFPTAVNAQALLADRANIGLLALAVMIPLAAGQFDLSVGFGLALTHVLVIGLQVKSGLPWPVAVGIVVVVGALIGLANGVLVAYAKIDSFIATLGSGTVVLAVTYWYTGGLQVYGDLPGSFTSIGTAKIVGIPLPAVIMFLVATVLWIAFEYLPVGRQLYALGANPRAAALVGIRPSRMIIGAFVASGVLVAVDGVLLASKLRIGQTSVGPDYLLPAFVGALLGATAIRPGRVNAWGTIVAVAVLAVGISGLQQEGVDFWVEPLFNGATLIIAVGLTSYAARRRVRQAASRAQAERLSGGG